VEEVFRVDDLIVYILDEVFDWSVDDLFLCSCERRAEVRETDETLGTLILLCLAVEVVSVGWLLCWRRRAITNWRGHHDLPVSPVFKPLY